MWVTVHLYAGMALALLPLPLWALVLVVLASHVVMDVIPHWDYTRTGRTLLWGSVDFAASLVTVLVGALLLGAPVQVVLLGILAAAPDFDVLAKAVRHRQDGYWFPSHWARFPHGATTPLPGIAVQAVIVIGSCLAFVLT